MFILKSPSLGFRLYLLLFIFPNHVICRDVNETFKLINVDRENDSSIQQVLYQEIKEYKSDGNFEHLKNIKLIRLFLSPDPKSPKTLKLLIWLLKNADENDYGLKSYLFFILSFHSNEMLIADADYFAYKSVYYSKKSGNEHIIPYLWRNLGMAYYRSGNYSKAKKYFHKAFSIHSKRNVFGQVTVLIDISNCLDEEGKTQEAYRYLLKAKTILHHKTKLSQAEKVVDNIVDFNIGEYLLAGKKEQEAEKLFLKCLRFRIQSNDPDLTEEVNILLKINKYNATKRNDLITFLKKQEEQCEILEFDAKYLKTYIDYFKPANEQQRKQYVHYLRKYSEVLAKISLKEQEYHARISEVGFLTLNNLIKDTRKISTLKLQNKTLVNRYSFVVTTLLFFTLLSFILYQLRISKFRAIENKKLFDEQLKTQNIEMELIQNTLSMKEEKLTQMYLHNQLKFETQKTFLEELKRIKRKKIDQIVLEDFVRDLYLKISNLIEIDKKTITTNHDFRLEKMKYLQELQLKHPELTKNELNFCVYFKLRLNAKEISGIEGITPASVRVYKTRIKQKLGIHGNNSIEEYLNIQFDYPRLFP